MTVIKFSTSAPAGFTFSGEFTAGVPAWWVTISNNDYRLFDGDYIIIDDNGVPSAYYSATQYASDLVVQNLVREAVGKELIRNIWSTLKQSLIQDTKKASIINTVGVDPALGMVRDGEITSARLLVNSINTNANFTTGVKTALLNLMDTAIAKL